MKDLYNSEKESVVKRLMERKKINNKNTSKKAGSNARITKNKTKNKQDTYLKINKGDDNSCQILF